MGISLPIKLEGARIIYIKTQHLEPVVSWVNCALITWWTIFCLLFLGSYWISSNAITESLEHKKEKNNLNRRATNSFYCLYCPLLFHLVSPFFSPNFHDFHIFISSSLFLLLNSCQTIWTGVWWKQVPRNRNERKLTFPVCRTLYIDYFIYALQEFYVVGIIISTLQMRKPKIINVKWIV